MVRRSCWTPITGTPSGFPGEVVRDLDGDADRTVCLWARIDDWNGGYLFHYGGSSDPGSYAPTLQETYEPTVEKTAAPSYLTWVPTTAPPPTPRTAPRHARPTVPRPYPTLGSSPAGAMRRGGGDGSRTTNRPNSMRPLACASAPRKAIW